MKTFFTCLLASTLLLATFAVPATARTTRTQVANVERIKIKVAKLGVGDKAKATVYLREGGKKKGYIAQAGDDEFVLRDRKTDAPTTIRYEDVTRIDSNRGHSTARNIAIGVTVGVGAVLTVLALLIAGLDD